MFCLAARSDFATIDKIAANDATLYKTALASWSQETKQLASRVLDLLEQEYLPQSGKPQLRLSLAIRETRTFVTGRSSFMYKTINNIIPIYNTKCCRSSAPE